jgi:hypothetical protein
MELHEHLPRVFYSSALNAGLFKGVRSNMMENDGK